VIVRAVCAALSALACASPAAAQLPKVTDVAPPLPAPVQEVVRQSPVQEVVEETPLQEVVGESPVPEVEDEVEGVVTGVTGGNGSGGDTKTPAAAPAQAGSSAPSAADGRVGAGPGSTPQRSGTRRGARERTATPRRGRLRGTRSGDRGSGIRDGRVGRAARSRADSRPQSQRSEDGNAVTRTVEKLVQVVPRIVWIALGFLLAAALALGARTFVERRRVAALARERERLRHEVGLLERALLPEVPEQLGALATSVAYRPCEGPAAGGDFYDAFELAGGRVAVLVGDVSGHGPDALECTNAIRTGIHACLEAGMSPRLALQSVAARNYTGSTSRFATVVVAVHDPSSGTLAYATAGHPPPIVRGPSAHEPVTAASSMPIGLDFHTGVRETTVAMPPGSIACLFTDGLLEARAGDELLGRERLTELVDALGPEPTANALLDLVIDEADEATDDMAALVLRAESGTEARAARIETLELDREDLDRGAGELFLEACGLSSEETERTLDEVRATTARTGGAVIDVMIDDNGARARVSPPRAPASPASV
jgi:Stage II sporulation protein E (SpoIIE)